MKLSIILSIMGLFLAQAAHARPLNGDTLGSSLTDLSTLHSTLMRISDPEQTIGKEAMANSKKVSKFTCSELGTAGGLAFAVNHAIRLYTPGYYGNETVMSKAIADQINKLINVIYDSLNDYCSGNSDDLNKVKSNVEKAKLIEEELSTLISIAADK